MSQEFLRLIEEDKYGLWQTVESSCRRLLNEQNRDRYSVTYGCFDRRYWGWKLVDYPEATFQRNVYPLAWLLSRLEKTQVRAIEVLENSVKAGIAFAFKIQHADGSFDQAFPNERSFGATAFLVHPLLKAYQIVQKRCSASFQNQVEKGLRQAGDFLMKHNEMHGHIANHLAGSVLSLVELADFFKDVRYEIRVKEILESILRNQSSEGWYLEYEGADPGYQTLCIYYLAQVYHKQPSKLLRDSLKKAVFFLSWFVHPDGTFGGEYGSRRTALFYPGGLGLLGNEMPLAASIVGKMLDSYTDRKIVTPHDVDMGNMAPLLSSYVVLLELDMWKICKDRISLPCEQYEISQYFQQAGLFVYGTPSYYAVLGISNGGVLKVFDKEKQQIILNDCGYIGKIKNGDYITTQITNNNDVSQMGNNEFIIEGSFFKMFKSTPTPMTFIILRILNLTVMHNIVIGNWVKRLLVKLLISGKKKVPLILNRTVKFERNEIIITDHLKSSGTFKLSWLEIGQEFVAIHMASSRYFDGFHSSVFADNNTLVNINDINSTGEVEKVILINFDKS